MRITYFGYEYFRNLTIRLCSIGIVSLMQSGEKRKHKLSLSKAVSLAKVTTVTYSKAILDAFMQRLVDKIQKEFYHISDYIEINALDGNGGKKLL